MQYFTGGGRIGPAVPTGSLPLSYSKRCELLAKTLDKIPLPLQSSVLPAGQRGWTTNEDEIRHWKLDHLLLEVQLQSSYERDNEIQNEGSLLSLTLMPR